MTYWLRNRGSKYIKQKVRELKGELDKFTGTDGDLHLPLSVIGRRGRQTVIDRARDIYRYPNYQSPWPKWYLWAIWNHCTVFIIVKCTWNIHQVTLYPELFVSININRLK